MSNKKNCTCEHEKEHEIELDEDMFAELLKHNSEHNHEPYIFEPIDTDNLVDCEINKDKFQQGLDDMSYMAGQITALANMGISPEYALDYLMAINAGEMTYKLQSKLSEDSKDTSIAVAKYTGENMAHNNY